jgi:hypothetical protein
MNHFAFGECGSAQNERGGLYITHVCDSGKAEPTIVIGEVIGYIVFTVSTTKSQWFLLVRFLDTLHFGETTELPCLILVRLKYSQQLFIGEVIGYATFW